MTTNAEIPDLAELPPENRKIGPLVWLSLSAPVILVILLAIYEIVGPIYLSVANHSGEPLTAITVTVQDHRIAIPDLPPGRGHRVWFRNRGTSSPYTLTATYGADQRIEETQGELHAGLLHGFYGPASFVVEKDGKVSFSEN